MLSMTTARSVSDLLGQVITMNTPICVICYLGCEYTVKE